MVRNNRTPEPQRFFSIDDAATWVGVSGVMIRDLIAEGKLTAYKLGPRSTRIDREELLVLMRGETHVTADTA